MQDGGHWGATRVIEGAQGMTRGRPEGRAGNAAGATTHGKEPRAVEILTHDSSRFAAP